ncbi:type II toxin-antitoxin system prevent-host-death family antitoxin [Dactylosporangium sp. NPDC005555]|uniref:type II toxin-antitoxin system prevent-host-death family antitoxin n=1 Tax=Dactylosporangium sp. NPDC005555 TaxID=3154889 RepID=UPI0033A3CF3C
MQVRRVEPWRRNLEVTARDLLSVEVHHGQPRRDLQVLHLRPRRSTRPARNRTCSRLTERGHGSWQFDCRVRDIRGRSTQVRRSGFPSQAAATRARDDMLDQSLERFTGQRWTVERWLRYRLTTRTSIRPTTLRVYTQHIEHYLIPHLGKLRLAEVTVRHLTVMFADLAKHTTRSGEPLAPATLHRIQATLRGALNAAVRNDMISDNPARRIELPSRSRSHAVVRTPQRVEVWRREGVREKVAVWTAEHLATFLNRVAADRLFAMWWLIALRGLRRGDAAGLRWCDVDLEHGTMTIAQQLTCIGHKILQGPPKNAASRRVVALDRHTVQALREHARRQRLERLAAGRAWQDTGYVFTRVDGRPLHPSERIEITVYGRPAAVLMSADDLAALEETVAVLSDPAALAGLIEGTADIAAGRVHDLDDVVAEFAARRRTSQ